MKGSSARNLSETTENKNSNVSINVDVRRLQEAKEIAASMNVEPVENEVAYEIEPEPKEYHFPSSAAGIRWWITPAGILTLFALLIFFALYACFR